MTIRMAYRDPNTIAVLAQAAICERVKCYTDATTLLVENFYQYPASELSGRLAIFRGGLGR